MKNKNNWKYIIAIHVLILGIITCDKPVDKAESNPIRYPVEVQPLEYQSYNTDYHSIGRIESSKQSNLFFQSVGKVNEILVDEGEYVSEKDVLSTIESEVYESTFAQAKSVFEKARNDLQSSKSLYESNVISSEQLENARINLNNAGAMYTQAENSLNNTSLTAPFSGWIVSKNVNIGDVTAAMQLPPFVLADMNLLKIDIPVPEGKIGFIRQGQIAKVNLKSFPNRTFEGVISKIGLIPINSSNYYNVEVELTGNIDNLKLGLVADVTITIDTKENAIVLPLNVIRDDGNSKFVCIAKDNQVHQIDVHIESISKSDAMITGSLLPGDLIITKGHNDVKSGMLIEIIKQGN